jgi:hypothetical protein
LLSTLLWAVAVQVVKVTQPLAVAVAARVVLEPHQILRYLLA